MPQPFTSWSARNACFTAGSGEWSIYRKIGNFRAKSLQLCGNRVGGSILNITIDIGWSVNVNVDITPNVAMQVGTWPELRKINCYQVL
jgi:hypothetical protein